MASIRKRGSAWHVQVRRSGQPSTTRSFKKKSDALEWARQIERQIDRRGLAPNRRDLERVTLGDLLRKYRSEVVVHKRSKEREDHIIGVLLRHRMSEYALSHVTPDLFRLFRDERLATVKASTVRRQLSILQHAFNVAMCEWGLPLHQNPVAAISKPTIVQHRERRLLPEERNKLLKGCAQGRVWWLEPTILLALETGMRRGELLNIHRSHIDFDRKTLFIPETKNGHPRTIPLTKQALSVLASIDQPSDRLFPPSANAFRLAWERLKRRVEIRDLRFHDLRHEAVSRFFEMGLNIPEVALISGHRDPRMLFRYTHLKPEDVARKLV